MSIIDGLLGVLFGEVFKILSYLGELLPLPLGDLDIKTLVSAFDKTIFFINGGFLPFNLLYASAA